MNASDERQQTEPHILISISSSRKRYNTCYSIYWRTDIYISLARFSKRPTNITSFVYWVVKIGFIRFALRDHSTSWRQVNVYASSRWNVSTWTNKTPHKSTQKFQLIYPTLFKHVLYWTICFMLRSYQHFILLSRCGSRENLHELGQGNINRVYVNI